MRDAITHDDKLALAAAAAANGGLLPEHLRGKAAGLELRAGDVIDLNLAQAAAEEAADAQDVHGRIVNGNLHLFAAKLTAADKKLVDGAEDHTTIEGYLGTVDGFNSTTAGLPAYGGVDGLHPSAVVGDVIQPTEGLAPVPADEIRPAPQGSSIPEAKAAEAAAAVNSVAGSKPKGK